MDFSLVFKSLFLGAGAGALYGVLFLRHKRYLLQVYAHPTPRTRFFLFIVFSTLRLGLLALLLWYVLRTPSLNIILVLASFFGAFWLAILQKKVRSHER